MDLQSSPEPLAAQLEQLVRFPRENLDIEIKSWIDLQPQEALNRAKIAKELIALANHGGGLLVFGLEQTCGEWEHKQRPQDVVLPDSDMMNSIVSRYAEPAFECTVFNITYEETGEMHAVVQVAAGRRPIRTKRDGPDCEGIRQNKYYIRKPGAKSEEIHKAEEWDQLIRRCVIADRERLLDHIEALLIPGRENQGRQENASSPRQSLDTWVNDCEARVKQLADEKLGRDNPWPDGSWSLAYSLEGDFDELSSPDFSKILTSVGQSAQGWPVWSFGHYRRARPEPYKGTVEQCLFDPDEAPFLTDYWRADPDGRLYLERGYQPDARENPGTAIWRALPIWRIGECLLHADRLLKALQASDDCMVHILARWKGLLGRSLESQPGVLTLQIPRGECQQDEVESIYSVLGTNINSMLRKHVLHITGPLYELFGFYEPSRELVENQLEQLRKLVPSGEQWLARQP